MPESAESMTTYQYAGNNAVMGNDPMGDLNRLPVAASGSYGNTVEDNNDDDFWDSSSVYGGGGGGGNYGAYNGSSAGGDYDPYGNIGRNVDTFGAGSVAAWEAQDTSPGYQQYLSALAGGPTYADQVAQSAAEMARKYASQNAGGLASSFVSYFNGILQQYSGKPDLDVAIVGGKLVVSWTTGGSLVESIDAGENGDININFSATDVTATRLVFDPAQTASDIWNSDIARAIVPDDITISVGGSAVGIFGMGGSFNLTLLTRGKDVGFHTSRTLSYKTGAELGAGFTITQGWFTGDPTQGLFSSLLGSGAESGGDAGVGLAGWTSFNSDAVTMFGRSVSLGPQVGGSAGLTVTAPGWW